MQKKKKKSGGVFKKSIFFKKAIVPKNEITTIRSKNRIISSPHKIMYTKGDDKKWRQG